MKESDIQKFQEENLNKNMSYEVCVGKLKENYKEINRMKDQVDTLKEENQKLWIRASMNFDQFTPRYKNLEEELLILGIKPPPPDLPKIKYVSTISFIQKLLEEIKNLNHAIYERETEIRLLNQENRNQILNRPKNNSSKRIIKVI